MLERVGLEAFAQRWPAQLSGGQQQRVGVARALAGDAPVLLMDEPFSAVDPVVRVELQDELLRLQADLGSANFLVLRNHGLLTVGKSIADAFLSMYTFENTCRIQIDAQAGGGELTQVDPRILAGMADVMRVATAGQGANIAWPALLRKVERTDPSYRT